MSNVASWSILTTRFTPGVINLSYLYHDKPKGLSSKAELFSDETSLFSVIHENITWRTKLIYGFAVTHKWEH